MSPSPAHRAVRFLTGGDGTLYLASVPDLVPRREGTAYVALGRDTLGLRLPDQAPVSYWRGTTVASAALVLDVELVVDPGGSPDVTYAHRDGAHELVGPQFRAAWTEDHGRLAVTVASDAPHAFGDVLHAAALAVLVARLIVRGGVALHGAAFDADGRCVVAFGPSGAGKSTLARRFADAVLTEEFAMLEPVDGGWVHALYAERRAAMVIEGRTWLPLVGVVRLEHGRGQTARGALTGAEAMPLLLEECTTFRGLEAQTLDNLAALLQSVGVARLFHALDDDDDRTFATLFGAQRA